MLPLIREMGNSVTIDSANRSIVESYAQASAFIIDIPSTALLEVLPLGRPVLLLSDERCVDLHGPARAALEHRVWLTESQSEFLRCIPEFVADPSGRTNIDESDTSSIDLFAENGVGVPAVFAGCSVIESLIRGVQKT